VTSTPAQTVLVTGASGFVGTALTERLRTDPRFRVRAASRRQISPGDGVQVVAASDLGSSADLSGTVSGVDVVVHLAARVHVMVDRSGDPLSEFRKANTAGTASLARQAAAAGARRFVYLSSIKVNGEETAPDRPFSERDHPRPTDAYGISKYEAELELRDVARETGMGVVVIRPPLIYGPGVKANFRRMMGWLQMGVPLPFGAIQNRRSLVSLDNLVDLVITAVSHARAANETFLAGDGEDLSTPELLRRLGLALGTPARLIPVPAPLVKLGLGMIGQKEAAQRLCGWLQTDISRARDVLNWRPPIGVDEGLRKVATDFLTHRS